MKPISPAVRSRIVDHLQRTSGTSIADAITKSTQIITFIDACGLEIVMPGWVPVADDGPNFMRDRWGSPSRKPFAWSDLAANLAEHEDREPWKPYNA